MLTTTPTWAPFLYITTYLTTDGECFEDVIVGPAADLLIICKLHEELVEAALHGRHTYLYYMLRFRGECRLQYSVTASRGELNRDLM